MNRQRIIALIAIALLPWAVACQDLKQDNDAAIRSLANMSIKSLESSDLNVRKEAEKALEILGEMAAPALRDATGSSNPHVKATAEHLLKIIALKEKIAFSSEVLKWYPDIYRDLASSGDATGIYLVFLRLTRWDYRTKASMCPVDQNDLAHLVSLMAERKYAGLNWPERWRVAAKCAGTCAYEGDMDGIHYQYWESGGSPITATAPFLVPLLKDEAGAVRVAAVTAFAEMKTKEYAKEIAPLLKDDEWLARYVAARALASMGANEFVKEIVALLKDPHDAIRRDVESILSKMDHQRVAKELIPMMIDDRADVRERAHSVLERTCHEIRFEKGIPAIANDLLPLLKDERADVRKSALDILHYVGAKEHAKDVALLLKDSDPDVRSKAMLFLSHCGGKEHATDVAMLLKDGDAYVRRSAVHYFWCVKAKEHAKDLIPLLGDGNRDVRTGVLSALTRLEAKEYTSDIVKLLKDDDSEVRHFAGIALSYLKATQYVKDIIPLMSNEETWYRASIADAIVSMTPARSSLSPDPVRGEVVRGILAFQKDRKSFNFHEATDILVKVDAIDYAKEIAGLLKDEDENVRAFAAEALTKLDVPEIIDDIIPLLKDKNTEIAVSAECLLVGLLDPGRGLPIRGRVPEYAKMLLPMLEDQNLHVRKGVASLFGAMKIKQYAVNLVPLLKDQDATVRAFSAIALTELGSASLIAQEALDDIKEDIKIHGEKNQNDRGRAHQALRALGVSQDEIDWRPTRQVPSNPPGSDEGWPEDPGMKDGGK